MALTRLHTYSGEQKYSDWAKKTLEAFAGIAPQFGMFAATYGLAATLFANHTIQVVITGAEGDAVSVELERTANSVFRFGKAVLRVSPGVNAEHLPMALRETLPHLPADKAIALVCFGNTCLPPTNEPEKLKAILENGVAGAAGN
jgi:uncharacterized protein YyaL (SSP411 family)